MTQVRSSVLLIDDEQDLLDLSKIFLEEDRAVTVTTARSADEALRLLKSRKFDVIVSDYSMPTGMNSIELLKTLKKSGDTTPFIIFTGKSREEVAIEALNSGASFYLQKGGDPEVQFTELRNMVIQISTRRQAELAFRESEELNRLFIEHAPMVIYNTCYTDNEIFLVAVNPEFQKLTGWSRGVWIGKSILSLIHPSDVPLFTGMKHTDPANTAPHKFEVRIMKSDGEYITGEFVTTPVIKHGRITGEFGIIRDVSEERRIAGLLLARGLELEEKNKELEAFCYSVSHDLRAPLRIIDGYVKILQTSLQEPVPPIAANSLSRIKESGMRMNRIIEDLLKLSRVGRAALTIEVVDLSKIAGDVTESLTRSDPGRVVHITIRPGLIARCDRNLITIALENLFDNAWKYTAKQEVAEICFDREQKGPGHDFFVIRDNGAGFDSSRAENLFMPFCRYHTESEFPGIGIGLATTKKIIQRHGGEIFAESKPGLGTSVYFSLGS
ncbi:MAG TPA: response regulator [Methanoregulaceae archaeon]|nr:response regulator [Methanoregulaceae archaeon]